VGKGKGWMKERGTSARMNEAQRRLRTGRFSLGGHSLQRPFYSEAPPERFFGFDFIKEKKYIRYVFIYVFIYYYLRFWIPESKQLIARKKRFK
jgi:hypothetical protein